MLKLSIHTNHWRRTMNEVLVDALKRWLERTDASVAMMAIIVLIFLLILTSGGKKFYDALIREHGKDLKNLKLAHELSSKTVEASVIQQMQEIANKLEAKISTEMQSLLSEHGKALEEHGKALEKHGKALESIRTDILVIKGDVGEIKGAVSVLKNLEKP